MIEESCKKLGDNTEEKGAVKSVNERQNKRINDFEKEYIGRIKQRLNEKLEESGLKKADLYARTQEMGFSFSDKALYNAFNYSETSLNSLVMIAICKVMHINPSWLFSEPDSLASFSSYSKEYISGADLYTVLTDSRYMHEYYCYTFRPTYGVLYQSCRLSMEKTGEDKSLAVLKISDEYTRLGVKENFTNVFTGVPVLCKADGVVYIVFTSDLGYMQLLCFDYARYRRADMYFRMGLLVLVNPATKTPQVQKLIISSRELEPEELPYAEGLLRVSDDRIILTKEGMEEVFEEYSDSELMKQFRRDFMPLFQLLSHPCYILNEKEILSYSASRLTEKERMRAIMLLKNKSLQPCEINMRVHEALPRMIKEGIIPKDGQ